MYLSVPINLCSEAGKIVCHALKRSSGKRRSKKVSQKMQIFFLFRMHYCSISRSGIPYNLSKKDADIFMLEICKKGSNRVVVF